MLFQPVVAGQFYTDNPNDLREQVDEFINQAKMPANLGDVFGLVSPHAGYIYSGPIAGHSYRAVKGLKYDVVVVIGLSHRAPGAVAVLNYDAYLTPLGKIRIDRQATAQLAAAADFIETDDDMFRYEHSLEVQLPFIQQALPDTPVVMISIGSAGRQMLRDLAERLDAVFRDRRALFVASTDLSHFRSYKAAREIDIETLDFLARNDLDGLHHARQVRERLCGLAPVTVLFELFRLRGGKTVKLLDYRNSGDTAGDKSRVVGYGALALLGAQKTPAPTADNGEGPTPEQAKGGFSLSVEAKKQLLDIARETITAYLRNGDRPKFQIDNPTLLAPGAAFVTLHKLPSHQLRGCIGQIIARQPLWECVRDMAIAAATEDPRFTRVRETEMSSLHIEISVLTPAEKVHDVSEIEVGAHGLIVSRGWQRGLLLPQVPTEYGWDRETFLDQTCRKAGLPANCWRDAGTVIEKFSALVFSE
jgi:AmmeMemoRadiSam system protein B/AmmeMemoRadiSam system protein A